MTSENERQLSSDRGCAKWTVESLREFEESIRQEYLAGRAQGAVHLSRGNEAQLIEVFKNIKREDWVFATYRAHYQALLHEVSRETLWNNIVSGHSINLCFAERRFYTSSIVGGCLPIAVGTALAIKRRGDSEHVWCFVGDMAASTGMFRDCLNYARGFDLPIVFVVEDNGYSTNTPTDEVWGSSRLGRMESVHGKIIRYKYEREWPHSGFKL